MNLKKLEKAVKILEQVKQIDKEIIELDKFASALASGNIESNEFNLSFKSIETPSPEPTEPNTSSELYDLGTYLSDGFKESLFNYGGRITSGCANQKRILNRYNIQSRVSESVALNILAVLLADEYDKRTTLINQIKSLGIEI